MLSSEVNEKGEGDFTRIKLVLFWDGLRFNVLNVFSPSVFAYYWKEFVWW